MLDSLSAYFFSFSISSLCIVSTQWLSFVYFFLCASFISFFLVSFFFIISFSLWIFHSQHHNSKLFEKYFFLSLRLKFQSEFLFFILFLISSRISSFPSFLSLFSFLLFFPFHHLSFPFNLFFFLRVFFSISGNQFTPFTILPHSLSLSLSLFCLWGDRCYNSDDQQKNV